jgi:hypothetical protein
MWNSAVRSLRPLGAGGATRARLGVASDEYAPQLLEADGGGAVAEAAQRAVAFEQRKDNEEARTWRHIEAALKAMRGPIAS